MVKHSFLRSGHTLTVHNTDLANRDLVLDKLREFFGWSNVVPISNYNRFALRSLVKDLSKFYGVPFEEVNAATKTVDDDVRKATMKHGEDKNLFVLTFEEAMAYRCTYQEPTAKSICDGCHDDCKLKPVSPSFKSFIDRHPEVAEAIKVLFKQNRSLGRHAGGVLIADDLPNKMPLVTSKGKNGEREPQSPWVEGVNYKHLEKVGNFIKYDLLGLETLRLIERSIEFIIVNERKRRGWIEVELEDGTKRCLFGDQRVTTSNRGEIFARDLGPSDDVLSFDVP